MPKAIKPHALSAPASPSGGKRLVLIVHTAFRHNTVSADIFLQIPSRWDLSLTMSGPISREN